MPQRVSAARSELKATQQRVLDAVEHDGAMKLTRGLYEEIAGVSRSQAAYDLAELVSAGILDRVGGGRSTWYRVVRTERNGQRHWTNDRIRSALEQFCDGRDTWPSASEFKAAGHSDLYVAASRYGGISFWTNELGFSRPARATAPQATPAPSREPRRRWRPKLGWAAGAVAFAAALFAAGGASLHALHGTSAHGTASRGTIRALHTPDPFSAARVACSGEDASRQPLSSALDAHGEGRARRPDRVGAREPAGLVLVHPSRGEDAAVPHAVRPGAASVADRNGRWTGAAPAARRLGLESLLAGS